MRNATLIPTLLVVSSTFTLPFTVQADTDNLIAELHANPPPACTAKSIYDKSSGISIFPGGKTDHQLRGVMGGLASMFLAEGGSRMSANNIQVVYTAVFYEQQPKNEIGLYGYKLSEVISPSMFVAHEELNGQLFVIGNRLLVLLWHENYKKNARCYEALKKLLLTAQ